MDETFGLSKGDLELIQKVLRKYPEVTEAFIFGSRALGKEKKGSDIDIALKGEEVSNITASISGILNDETPLPYTFDVIDYEGIDNTALKEHINRVGRTFYKK